jgi:hypothetical protein
VKDVQQLTDALAREALGWKTAPDRYLLNDRRWLPKWRFQPTKNIADAFQLLEAADVLGYALRVDRNGVCRASVRTKAASAEASGPSVPRAICVAFARVYGIRVEEREG